METNNFYIEKNIFEIKAPNPIPLNRNRNVFLAGTIDMGNSIDWQQQAIKEITEKTENVNILNPRRDFWKEDWKPEFEDPNFSEQVNWELNAMEKANYILVNLLPDSKSPITLLELGLYADTDKLIVCCPNEFYRSGNVHIVCDKYYIPLFKEFNHAVEHLIKKLS